MARHKTDMKDGVRVFYITAELIDYPRPTRERFIGDRNTSPRLSVLDNSWAGQVSGCRPRVMATESCTSYVPNDIVGVVSKPRYGAGKEKILTHVGPAFFKSDITCWYSKGRLDTFKDLKSQLLRDCVSNSRRASLK